MPISQTAQVFALVKSLSKSEKRIFRLYVKRLPRNEQGMFLKLFDLMDRQGEINETELYKKLGDITKSQFSNLKRHLYSQILIALRNVQIQKHVDIEIRQQMDFARILYSKGLTLQSLKLLERVEKIAYNNHQDFLHLEIIEFRKLIETRHITRSRSVKDKVQELLDQSTFRNEVVYNISNISNLIIMMHGLYIQIGHIRNDKDRLIITEYFESNLKKIRRSDLTFFEKTYLHQCHVWYHYMLGDFESVEEWSLKWINEFEFAPEMKMIDPDLYMRAYHYGLTALFHLKKADEYSEMIEQFEVFYQANKLKFNQSSKAMSFVYLYLGRLNRLILQGDFIDHRVLIGRVERRLKKFEQYLDPHRHMLFYYKIGWILFGNEDYEKSVDYLNRILNNKVGVLREDIQYYSRVLHLMCHYELENYALLEYLIPSVKRYSEKLEMYNTLQEGILTFMSQIVSLPLGDRSGKFKEYREKWANIDFDPRVESAFVYLDFLSWVESKLEEKSLTEVIRGKSK